MAFRRTGVFVMWEVHTAAVFSSAGPTDAGTTAVEEVDRVAGRLTLKAE